MYDKSDPRASLAPAGKSMLTQTGLIAEAQEARFYETAPQIDTATEKTWLHRGHNFLVAFSDTTPGASLERVAQPDEYALLLDQSGAQVTWGGETHDIAAQSLVFIPAGDSTVHLPDGGKVTRILTTRASDLSAACGNADGYDVPRAHIPDFAPWPAPKDGWKVRAYGLDIPETPGRFGRIFRCSTLMVNVLYPFEGPRDAAKMSPHHHDDFEQGSLALEGTFTHYLRWPWTSDMADWQPDQALEMGAASMLVIPPPVIHTTRATGPGTNRLVDIFSPPRVDFSAKPGWVLNAEDYPMPDAAQDNS